MKISKDEARILCAALDENKYEIVNNSFFRDLPLMGKLNDLQKKLGDFGNDKRRTGRTSQNDWSDLLIRFSNK